MNLFCCFFALVNASCVLFGCQKARWSAHGSRTMVSTQLNFETVCNMHKFALAVQSVGCSSHQHRMQILLT